MFNLFSKKKSYGGRLDFSLLHTDMHAHLLPGIDDGARDMEDSLVLIRGLAELGYKKLITTPHILWDMYQNTPAIINQKLAEVNKAVKDAAIPVTIEAAAEYFLDEHVEELLYKKEPLLTFGGNKVLAEFSMVYPPLNVKTVLFDMQMQGYQPVVAHPERYIYLQRNKEFYTELRDAGCLFQLNILSLTGNYGKSVASLAQYLLDNGFYSLIGTDLHHTGHLEALKRVEMTASLQQLLQSGQVLNSRL